MKNLWQQMREYLPMAAVLLLCMIIVPAAQASTGNNGGAATATAQQAVVPSAAAVVSDDTDTAKARQKVSTKPREKSILDTEVLESPMAYFRNAFFSEEDSADSSSSSGAIMITVKALVATLLSTIM